MNTKGKFKKSLITILGTAAISAMSLFSGDKIKAEDSWILNHANNHYYKLGSVTTWEKAQAEAVAQGGYLTTINNAEENRWLAETFLPYGGQLWIGFSDAISEGTWIWSNNEAAEFTSWGPGEPNNSGDEDYAGLHPTDLTWNDFAGFYDIPGIIEKDSNIPQPAYYLHPGDSINNLLDSIIGTENNPTILYLAPGVYKEDVTMDKYEHIIGESREKTIIEGKVATADDTILASLTVKNPKYYGESVCVDSTNSSSRLANINVDGNGNRLSVGILFAGQGSDNAYIADSEIINHGIGMSIHDSGAVIERNYIGNCEYGIWFFEPGKERSEYLQSRLNYTESTNNFGPMIQKPIANLGR